MGINQPGIALRKNQNPGHTHNRDTLKIPGHWLLARLGKRVLRPGGIKLTCAMLDALCITPRDEVVEFAPGLGITARLALARKPKRYTAIERDEEAAKNVRKQLTQPNTLCLLGNAEETGLPDEAATIVYGEAMLSMQSAAQKHRIISEAWRILKPGGRYGLHELCLNLDESQTALRKAIERDMAQAIHVGVRPLTLTQWQDVLKSQGFVVVQVKQVPMHLLEPKRFLEDEGLIRTLRIVFNLIRDKDARNRVMAMRKVFQQYAPYLCAVMMVCRKP